MTPARTGFASQDGTNAAQAMPQTGVAPRVAHIVSVSGAQAVAILERTASASPVRVEIGATMTIPTPRATVVGLVSAVSVPLPDAAAGNDNVSLIELNLAGEIVVDQDSSRLVFRRGVSSLPSIGDCVQLADRQTLALVYSQPECATIDIGTLFQNATVPARLLVDDLFGKHFLIVGTTGCGKSSALTCILRSLLPEYKQARVVILDIHNEYSAAFGEQAETIDPASLNLPFWLLNFQELISAFVSADEHREAEIEILRDAVLWAKRRYSDSFTGRTRRVIEGQFITVDTPVPFRLADLIAYIDAQLGRLDRTLRTLPYKRLSGRIENLVSDSRYSFMFGSLMIEDTMIEVLGRLFRVPVDDKPITVLNLSDGAGRNPGRGDFRCFAPGVRSGELERCATSDPARLRGGPPLRAGGRRQEIHAHAPGAGAHRQGRPQIRRLAGADHPAAERTRSHHPVAMLDGDRDAPLH